MAQQRTESRLVVWLWILASALAWAAAAISYFRGAGMNWSMVAAGFLCAAFGIGAWKRVTGRAASSGAEGRNDAPRG